MCVIAGYIGDRDAAPILVEMLRRQQHFDGSLSTGIATVHEGKLYCKRVLGDLDAFLEQVDLKDLPGTVGIAHSRPDNNFLEYVHPYISNNEKLAVVSNGTGAQNLGKTIAEMLIAEGYTLPEPVRAEDPEQPHKKGDWAALGDVIVNQTQKYITGGMEYEAALAATVSDLYGERVSVMLNADAPDRICVARQTRPMEALMAKGESFIATSRFGFPEEIKGTAVTLPVLRVCSVRKDGIQLTPHVIEGDLVDGVCEITPLTHIRAYSIIEAFLKGKKDQPVNLDEVYFELKKHPDIFQEKYDFAQYAKVIYDILWQLSREGRLRTEVRPHMTYSGIRSCVMLWLD